MVQVPRSKVATPPTYIYEVNLGVVETVGLPKTACVVGDLAEPDILFVTSFMVTFTAILNPVSKF